MQQEPLKSLGIPQDDPVEPRATDKSVSRPSASRVTAVDRWLVRKILSATRHAPIFIELWNGEVLATEGVTAQCGIRLHSRRALIRLIIHPTLNFGDLYCLGELEAKPELRNLLLYLRRPYTRSKKPLARLWQLLFWRNNRARKTTLHQAKENIHHHYDLAARLWRQCRSTRQ